VTSNSATDPRARRPLRWLVLGAGVLLPSLVAASLAAAQAPPIPSTVLPGRIEQQYAPPPELAPALPPAPVPEEPVPPEEPSEGGIQFVLKGVTVEGSTIYTAQQLEQAYAPFIGKTVSVDELPQIEEAITVLYRRDGYILSHAMIDPQAIDPQQGLLHVKVFEGYIDTVRLDPLDYEVGKQGALLRAILQHIAHGCRPGQYPVGDKPCPLHRDVLERYLLLANDLPGVQASAVIQPSLDAESGADLFVTIDEKPVELASSLDNRGSSYVGPLTAHQSAEFSDILGFFERTELRAAQSIPFNELQLFNGVEEVPLNSNGLRLALDFTHTRSRPGGLLRDIDLTTLGDAGGATIAYPLLRTRSENLQLRASIELRNSITTHGMTDATAFYDRSRDLTVGASYDLADRYLGVNLADVSMTQGIPLLGATPESSAYASHIGASPHFTKLDGEVSRLQQIHPEVNLLVAATGQDAFSKLLSAEQFGFGGDDYGRAYDPSEILGDRGIAAKAELQYTPDWLPALISWYEGVRSVQFYAFYDIGRIWSDPGPSTNLSAASAGGGMRFTLTDHFAGYFEVAKPLTRYVEAVQAVGAGGKEPRFFFNVAGKF
jgi:hemolysin activation/secretion protein